MLEEEGVSPCGVFLDLGISSPQFDEAHRGFRPERRTPFLSRSMPTGLPFCRGAWFQAGRSDKGYDASGGIGRSEGHNYIEWATTDTSRPIREAVDGTLPVRNLLLL